MSKDRIHFTGLLANVDSSILNVKLDHGFTIVALPEDTGCAFFSYLEKLSCDETIKKLFMEYPCFNSSEQKYFAIYSSYACDAKDIESFLNEPGKIDNEYILGYLDPTLRLMRLYKEGNIFMPLRYYYFIEDNIPERITSIGTHWHISMEPYDLKVMEIPDLENFIQNTKLPFEKQFLQLAFENFELSYHTQDADLSFLSLIMSMESLFNRGEGEIAYTIARNTAVIIGQTEKDSKDVFNKMKKLYGKRSEIIHKGVKCIDGRDVTELRHYVRESIKQIYRLGKTKDEVFDLLNALGYGQRSLLSAAE